jgi:hypothetical protein
MKRNKSFTLMAGSALVLSMLACNLGKVPADNPGAVPAQQDSNNQATQAPANNPPAASPGGACSNPYLPVVAGAVWNYKMTGAVADNFTRSIVSVDAGSFTDQDIFSQGSITRQGKWNCDNGNLIALNPSNGASANVSSDKVSADFKTTELSGVTLPASIKPGDTWTQNTTLEGVENINGQQIPAKNKFTNTCKADGVESVTVEAGTFNAMKVECQTAMEISITMQQGGNPINTNLTFNSTTWYVEKIGQVKTTSSGTNFNSDIELASYHIP